MNIENKLIPITWLPYSVTGYGCGYIGLPDGHPWHGKHYDTLHVEYNIDVHGGLTYSENHPPGGNYDGLWWIGFDTAHWNDNPTNCDEKYCLHQIERLKKQALDVISEDPEVITTST